MSSTNNGICADVISIIAEGTLLLDLILISMLFVELVQRHKLIKHQLKQSVFRKNAVYCMSLLENYVLTVLTDTLPIVFPLATSLLEHGLQRIRQGLIF